MNDLTVVETQTPATLAEAYHKMADEAGGGSGELLKFKRGKFVKGADEEEVPHGMRYAANMAEITRGFIKFADEGVEKVMARSGERRIDRETLGETDESQWEKDDNGALLDPWSETWELPLKDAATGDEIVFATSSAGGIGVLGKLCRAYGNRLAMGDRGVPIIELGASSYRHKRFGEVDVPTFKVVSWRNEEELIASEAADDVVGIDGAKVADLDDEVPF